VFIVYEDEQLQVSGESDTCMEATEGTVVQAACDEDAPGQQFGEVAPEEHFAEAAAGVPDFAAENLDSCLANPLCAQDLSVCLSGETAEADWETLEAECLTAANEHGAAAVAATALLSTPPDFDAYASPAGTRR